MLPVKTQCASIPFTNLHSPSSTFPKSKSLPSSNFFRLFILSLQLIPHYHHSLSRNLTFRTVSFASKNFVSSLLPAPDMRQQMAPTRRLLSSEAPFSVWNRIKTSICRCRWKATMSFEARKSPWLHNFYWFSAREMEELIWKRDVSRYNHQTCSKFSRSSSLLSRRFVINRMKKNIKSRKFHKSNSHNFCDFRHQWPLSKDRSSVPWTSKSGEDHEKVIEFMTEKYILKIHPVYLYVTVLQNCGQCGGT